MDYKEKYDTALGIAKMWHKNTAVPKECKVIFEQMFPELKESKDEKIRKNLLGYIKGVSEREVCKETLNDWIAWLEKQGKKDPCVGCTCENGNLKEIEVEPKFKVGDWVVFIASESIYQVEKIENYEYTLRHILGGSLRLSFSNEELIREWTIADAKEGDVIYVSTEVKGIQAIFHKFENGIIYFHCNLCTDFTQGGYEPSGDVEFVMPLPKIHYQKFFQKMKEAGYEWDVKNKRLTKKNKKL